MAATIEGATMNIRPLAIAAATLLASAAWAQHGGHAAPHGPYAGLQSRDIKALSAEEVRSLLQGEGMRLALAAELNGYPGPAHVLEHADALQLTPQQRSATQALMDTHKAEARALGERTVAAERALDRAFAGRALSEADVARHTQEIARLLGELRAAHLRTHLQQAALLTQHQIHQYQRLRGYTSAAGNHGGHQR
jgi:hypothetical protein